MDDETRRQHGRSFGTVAELYDRIRPPYPADAARWLVGAVPCRVVRRITTDLPATFDLPYVTRAYRYQRLDG